MTSKTARKPKSAPAKAEPVIRQNVVPTSAAFEPSASPAAPSGKLGDLLKLLRRKTGASIADLTTATGWQAHSVRGAISGAIRKRLGLAVERTKTDGTTRYRIAS